MNKCNLSIVGMVIRGVAIGAYFFKLIVVMCSDWLRYLFAHMCFAVWFNRCRITRHLHRVWSDELQTCIMTARRKIKKLLDLKFN